MDRKLRVLDLFSGIGGFSLGLERSGGFETVAFCEIEDYPRRVLARHWPSVPIYDDVRTLTADTLRRDGIAVDVICGGFPCQDLSFAGRRAGLQGERSGLWGEYRRLIGELRPRFVIVENVPGLLSLGMGTVLGDLAALRYDATWHCIPASAVGAPHRRDRVWIVANATSKPQRKPANKTDPFAVGWQARHEPGDSRSNVADTSGAKLATPERKTLFGAGRRHEGRATAECSWWSAEPNVGRVVDGVSKRVDRISCLGNAVVPQIPEIIGRAIIKSLNQQRDNPWTA